MSSIAVRVGGSKTTLWNYFPSKEALFAAVIDGVVEQYGTALAVDFSVDEPVETVLYRFGSALLDTVLSGPIIALHRMVIAEAVRFPELSEMFFERGAKRGQARLAGYLRSTMDRGLLQDGDATVSAKHFTALCLSGCFQLALLGIADQPTRSSVNVDLDNAISTAMRAWM